MVANLRHRTLLDVPDGPFAVGGYQAVEEIGRGGMGVVYRGEHELLGRRAALKLIRRDCAADPDLRDRFVAEARAASKIEHPNVVRIHDLGSHPDGRPCIVMEYLEGYTLDALLEGDATEAALPLIVQLCDAVAAVHAAGIVHRDIKPQNVFVARVGERAVAKLIDFGIAKVHGLRHGISAPGLSIGTPQYMAPEQLEGRAVDGRTDLYAIGVLAYQAVVGELPYKGRTCAEALLKQTGEDVCVPSHVPAPLRSLLEKALSRNPAGRFSSARELGDALAACISGGERVTRFAPAAPPSTPAPRTVAARPSSLGRTPLPTLSATLGITVDGFTLRVRYPSAEALQRAEETELAQGRLLLPWSDQLGDVEIRRLAVDAPGRMTVLYDARVVVRVDHETAKRWNAAPGLGLSLKKMERPQAVLDDLRERAARDAVRGDFQGVALAVQNGLQPPVLQQLHARFCAEFPDRVRRAGTLALEATALEGMNRPLALSRWAEALALDPLNREYQLRHAVLKRQVEPEPLPATGNAG